MLTRDPQGTQPLESKDGLGEKSLPPPKVFHDFGSQDHRFKASLHSQLGVPITIDQASPLT